MKIDIVFPSLNIRNIKLDLRVADFLKIDIVFPSLNVRNRLDLRVEK